MPSSSSPRAAAAAGADLEGRAAATSPAVNPAAGVPAASPDGDSAAGSAPDSAGDGSSRGKQQRMEAEDGSRRAKKPRMAEAEAHSPPAASGRETVCGADVDEPEAIDEGLDIRHLEVAGAHTSEVPTHPVAALTVEDLALRPDVVTKLAVASTKMCCDELASDLARLYQGNMDDLLPATIALTCLVARAWKLDKEEAARRMAEGPKIYECLNIWPWLFAQFSDLTAEDLALRPEAVEKLAAASSKMCCGWLAEDLARRYQGNMDDLLPATISLTYVIARAWMLNKEEEARKMADSYAVLVDKAQQETNQANEKAKKLKDDLAAMAKEATKQVNEAQKRERDQAAKLEQATKLANEAQKRERVLAAKAEEATKQANKAQKRESVLAAKAEDATKQANEAQKRERDLAAKLEEATKLANQAQKRERDLAAKLEEATKLANEAQKRERVLVAKVEEGTKQANEAQKRERDLVAKVETLESIQRQADKELLLMKAKVARAEEAWRRAEEERRRVEEQLSEVRENSGKREATFLTFL